MFVVDTNIFVYAANLDAPEHEIALTLLDKWRQGEEHWFATWSILYGFLRIITHGKIFPVPFELSRAWTFVQKLLASPSFDVLIETERHEEIVDEIVSEHHDLSGSILHDVHIAAIMREHGIQDIRTNDQDFDRFDFLRVVNPFTALP
ncbi:MAG: type II toxin-antitoxin system VapC family toxin [Thermoleophilaceae bacterium]